MFGMKQKHCRLNLVVKTTSMCKTKGGTFSIKQLLLEKGTRENEREREVCLNGIKDQTLKNTDNMAQIKRDTIRRRRTSYEAVHLLFDLLQGSRGSRGAPQAI